MPTKYVFIGKFGKFPQICPVTPGFLGNIVIFTILHSERPKLCGVLAVLSAIGLNRFQVRWGFDDNSLR